MSLKYFVILFNIASIAISSKVHIHSENFENFNTTETPNGFTLSKIEEDCINCISNDSKRIFFKEIWWSGLGTPLYTCKILPFLVSRFAIVSEFSCNVDDCFNIDSREATRIYKRENIHCLKLSPSNWALDERQSVTYNISYNGSGETDDNFLILSNSSTPRTITIPNICKT